MHIYNNIHAFLTAPSYMFRRLVRHLQGELYRMLKAIVTLITDLKLLYTWVKNNLRSVIKVVLYIGLYKTT